MNPSEFETYISSKELSPDLIKAQAEKLFVWNDPAKKNKTEYAVVYIHGFTATRREIDPIPRKIAASLGANLFYTRLTGHGLRKEAHKGVRMQDWLDDAVEALEAGKAIGDKLILMGTSTGGTLATWLALGPDKAKVAALLMVSPNFKLADPAAWLLPTFLGPFIARLVVGEYRKLKLQSSLEKEIWDEEHHFGSLIQLGRLLKTFRDKDFSTIQVPTQIFYNLKDKQVDERMNLKRFALIPAAHKEMVETQSENPDFHVLAGDAMSPSSNDFVYQKMTEFLKKAGFSLRA